MRITQIVRGLMVRLGNIPGLGFLHGYLSSAKGMKAQFGQRKGDYLSYVYYGKSAVNDVREAAGQGRGGGEGGGEGDSDDGADDYYEEEFEEDYYDLYEDEGVSSQGAHDPVDDYPASDEDNSYFDDDYRR